MGQLYDKLVQHNKKNVYPMHMPGHKRNTDIMEMVNPYGIDITEIDGFDNMHNPREIIKSIEDRASELYDVKRTFISVNGTSMGIVAAIHAIAVRKGKILIARNCHKSVYNAIELMELEPKYIYPKVDKFGIGGEIFLTDIEKEVEKDSEICVVVVTNPSYEGSLSDIKAISTYLHSKGIPLIVDAAHGAHLGFHDGFAKNSIEGDADIVIHSIHKTLPAFTQTSLVHVVSDKYVDIEKIARYMRMFQSTSPSYILMAGIEKCIEVVRKQKDLFGKFNNYLEKFYKRMSKLRIIKVLDYRDACGNVRRDKTKIVIVSTCRDYNNYGGQYIYDRLRKDYNIQLEMKSLRYALAMTSICDTEEGFDRLAIALEEIDKDLTKVSCGNMDNSVSNVDNSNVEKAYKLAKWDEFPIFGKNYTHYPPSIIQKVLITSIRLCDAVNKISGEYVYLYPPDIPLIVPGEQITIQLLEIIDIYKRAGFSIEGLDKEMTYIKVIAK